MIEISVTLLKGKEESMSCKILVKKAKSLDDWSFIIEKLKEIVYDKYS